MNIFELCIRSVVRKPVKSILLLLIVFVSVSFLYSGYACRNASVQTQNRGRQAVGASFRLEGNEADRHNRIDKLAKQIGEKEGSLGGFTQKQLPSGEWLSTTDHSFETLLMEDIQTLSQVEGIEGYNVTTVNTVVNPVNFQRIEEPDMDQNNDELGVSLRGNRDMRYDSDIQKGNIKVEEGRLISPEDKDVCVISREIAQLNDLKVGDELQFNDWKERETSKVYTAEIVGIYDTVQKIEALMAGDSYRSENIIFTDLSFPEKPQGYENNPLYQYATFWVENVDNYEEIKDRMKEAEIGWERYDFLDNTGMSDTLAENFKDLSKISDMTLIFVIASSALILMFVFLFWMKSRVHEMGVLLSIGRNKAQILLQILLEGLLIGTAAFILASVSAPAAAEKMADYLVGNQIELSEEKKKSEEGMVESGSKIEEEDEVVGVTVGIGSTEVMRSALASLGIITVSVMVSGIYIYLKRPKEILSQMS